MKSTAAFIPEEYDKKIKQTLPYCEEFYRQIADVIKCLYTGKVSWLDVGCGTGKMAELGSELEDRLVLCDNSSDMLDIAKKRIISSNVEFVLKPAQELEYKNEFDVVTAVQVFHYLTADERRKAIGKCFDALRPNGIFITFENFAPDTEFGTELSLKRWMKHQEENGRAKTEINAHISRYGKDYFPITINEHKKLLRECGFKAVELLWCSYMQAGLVGIK